MNSMGSKSESRRKLRIPGPDTMFFVVLAITVILTVAPQAIYRHLLEWQALKTYESCNIASYGTIPGSCYTYTNWVLVVLILIVGLTIPLFINATLFCIAQALYRDWDGPERKYMGSLALRFACGFVVCALTAILIYQCIDLLHPWMPISVPTRPAGSLPITITEYA